MSPHWKKIRHRLEFVAMQWFVEWLPRLSREVLLALADFAGDLFFSLDSKSRAVSLANLDLAFGEDYLPGEKNAIARLSFRNLARTFFDLFWLSKQTPETFRRLVDVIGWENIRLEKNRPMGHMFISGHIGNFEIGALAMGLMQFPIMGVGQDIKNPAITPLFARARCSSGNELISKTRAALRMLRQLKRGRSCALLVDLTLKLNEPGHLIKCFGKEKWVTGVHVVLGKMAEAQLIPVVCLPIEDGRYQLRLLPEINLGGDPPEQELTQLCWDRLEPYIRERPERWLWSYKHWRYREENTCGFPFYAKTSKQFQKIISRKEQ